MRSEIAKQLLGKYVAPGEVLPRSLPPEDSECTQEQIDEWLDCSTPLNEAAAMEIQRREWRDKTRERRARQDPVENSDFQVPVLPVPDTSSPSGYGLPGLARQVAEMDAIRVAQGNPFPYTSPRPRHLPPVNPPHPLRRRVDYDSSRAEANFPQRRYNPPRSSNIHRNSHTSNLNQTSRPSNLHQTSRTSNVDRNPRTFLRLPPNQRPRSPSIDVPVNASGHFGRIAGEDEVGVIFDYSNLIPQREGSTLISQDAGECSKSEVLIFNLFLRSTLTK
jgi:hypothetical protein